MPDNLLNDKTWQQALADMVDGLAEADFYTRFAHGCELLSGCQSTLVVWLDRDHRPLHLYDDLPQSYADASKASWFAGSYLLDPFYALFLTAAPEGIYRLRDLAPDNFYETPYYRDYYQQTGLSDEIGLLINLNTEHSMLVSLGSRDNTAVNPGDWANLQLALPVLTALCRKQQSSADGQVTFAEPLDRAFRNFGRDHLSKRECEVVQLLLKGHSNKSIARLLDISVDTVKVYNKRFHSKLDISSQTELFSLFLESISMVPFDADIDPLSHYLELTGKQMDG